jgi:hypothetical protein
MQEVDELNEIMEEIEPRNLAKPEHGGGEAGDERSVCTQLDDVRELLKAIDKLGKIPKEDYSGFTEQSLIIIIDIQGKADKVRENII